MDDLFSGKKQRFFFSAPGEEKEKKNS